MKIIILTILLLISTNVHSKFYVQHSLGYQTHSEDVENTAYSLMGNLLFIGASIGSSQTFYFGQSLHMSSLTYSTASGSDGSMSTTGIGPRFIWFFNDNMEWNLSFAWHPYSKGTRTKALDSSDDDISGSSMIIGLSYQLKITKGFFLGASMNYYTYSVTKETDSSDTSTDVTNTYTTIMPMIDLSFRFR